MKRIIELYPLWLRIWHWSNAVSFLMLIVTGISLHFATPGAPLIPFDMARLLHNIFGLLLVVGWMFFVIKNFRSGNSRHYRLQLSGLFGRMKSQALFYGVGIFRGAPHPFPTTSNCKFNPLQQVTYLAVMFGAMPLLIITGLLFLFPEYAPQRFMGMNGLWVVAIIHYVIGLFLTTFMIGHIYLATAGENVLSEFKKMVFGSNLTEEGS